MALSHVFRTFRGRDLKYSSDTGYISGEYVLAYPANKTSASETNINFNGAANLLVLPCFAGTNISQVCTLSV